MATWTEATLPKTKAEVVALLNGLESQVTALQAQVASLTSERTALQSDLAIANATISVRTTERDMANQAALEEAMAHAVTRAERDALQATVGAFAPKQACLNAMQTWLDSLVPAGVSIPLVEVP